MTAPTISFTCASSLRLWRVGAPYACFARVEDQNAAPCHQRTPRYAVARLEQVEKIKGISFEGVSSQLTRKGV
jgi:hypothetical protein